MIRLQYDEIDYPELTDQVRTPTCGAVVLFLGTVRELTEGRVTVALDYEAYPEMAEKKLAEIEQETRQRWPVGDIALVHRLGRLELGEVSVAVVISCPHRAQAFDACRFAIDRVKEMVPIWKKENWADGTGEWVHPAGEYPQVCIDRQEGSAMFRSVWATVRNGKIELMDDVQLGEGTKLLVTLIRPELDNEFWPDVSQSSLAEVWDNPQDDTYAQLLKK